MKIEIPKNPYYNYILEDKSKVANLPEDTNAELALKQDKLPDITGEGGKFLKVKGDESGYEYDSAGSANYDSFILKDNQTPAHYIEWKCEYLEGQWVLSPTDLGTTAP